MMDTSTNGMRRRVFLQRAGALGLLAALGRPVTDAPGERVFDLTIDHGPLPVNGRVGKAVALNGTVPGPLLRLREADNAALRVTNRLQEITSIHSHGVLVPPNMDGVPGARSGGI